MPFTPCRVTPKQVVESMVNGLISLDNQGKIVTMNRQAYHIFRASANRKPGRQHVA
jgi:PAS domain-containing protein